MPTFFRNDGWVKATTGQAVPGAQIYVATQPANVAFAPPSPLASIFSDPNGLVPITQPILTDGFGHYDFYVLPDTYTIMVALGGVVQQVYTDQSIGVAGGGSGTVSSVGLQADPGNVLSVSGSPITTFGTIDLSFSVQSANKIFSGPASGPPAVPTYRSLVLADLPSIAFSNITGNISTGQMNSGTGATSSTFWRGDGTWASAGASFSTAGTSWFHGGQTLTSPSGGGTGFASDNTANRVYFCYLNLLAQYTIRQVVTRCQSGSGAATFATCGIYDSTGSTLLLNAGASAFNTQNGVTNLVATISPVVLSPGVYIFAWGATANSSGQSGASHVTGGVSGTDQVLSPMNAVANIVGFATNTLSGGGGLPATLGALTAFTAMDIPVFTFMA